MYAAINATATGAKIMKKCYYVIDVFLFLQLIYAIRELVVFIANKNADVVSLIVVIVEFSIYVILVRYTYKGQVACKVILSVLIIVSYLINIYTVLTTFSVNPLLKFYESIVSVYLIVGALKLLSMKSKDILVGANEY